MPSFVYLILAAIIYGLLADRLDRAADHELRKRRVASSSLGLVEEFDAKPDLGPRHGRLLRFRRLQGDDRRANHATPAPRPNGADSIAL